MGVVFSIGLLLAKRVCSGAQVQQLASCIFFPPSSCRLLVVVSFGFTCNFGVGFGSGLCARARAYAYLRTLGIGFSFSRSALAQDLTRFGSFVPPPFFCPIIMADAQAGRRRRAAQAEEGEHVRSVRARMTDAEGRLDTVETTLGRHETRLQFIEAH